VADATRRADRSVRVLVVCAVNGHGGPIQSIATVVSHARRSTVTFATQARERPDQASAIEQMSESTIDVVRPAGFGRMVVAQVQLVSKILRRRRDFDVIHANGLTEVAMMYPLAALTRLPVVVWVHNSERPDAYRFIEPLLRLSARGWTWLAVSPVAAAQVAIAHPEIVSNPVDRRVVAGARSSVPWLRVTYLAGTDRPHKGFDLLPEIISAVSCRDVVFTVVTSPPYSSPAPASRAAWDSLAESADERIRVTERVGDVSTILAETDVILAPSRRESFNRVIAEGIANGLPFVATDIAAHRALAALTGAGELFPTDDPERAGELLDRLAADPAHLVGLRKRAHESSSMFDALDISARVEEAWTLASRRRP